MQQQRQPIERKPPVEGASQMTMFQYLTGMSVTTALLFLTVLAGLTWVAYMEVTGASVHSGEEPRMRVFLTILMWASFVFMWLTALLVLVRAMMTARSLSAYKRERALGKVAGVVRNPDGTYGRPAEDADSRQMRS